MAGGSGLVKVALRREQDGTPIGHPAPCYFLCPCKTKVPVYDRQGQRINGDSEGVLTCSSCGQRMNVDGWLLEGAA